MITSVVVIVDVALKSFVMYVMLLATTCKNSSFSLGLSNVTVCSSNHKNKHVSLFTNWNLVVPPPPRSAFTVTCRWQQAIAVALLSFFISSVVSADEYSTFVDQRIPHRNDKMEYEHDMITDFQVLYAGDMVPVL